MNLIRASVLLLLIAVEPLYALTADNLLLLVNKNVPESQRLAEFYKNARLVPDGRILAVPLPGGDDIGFAVYERDVVPAVRKFLRDNKLETTVTCIVTFHGVPLRITPSIRTIPDREELAQLTMQHREVMAQIVKIVESLEASAAQSDPSFAREAAQDLDSLTRRMEAAYKLLLRRAGEIKDLDQQREQANALLGAMRQLAGPAWIVRHMGPLAQAERDREQFRALGAQVEKAAAEIDQLLERRYEREARKRLIKLMGEGFGLLELARRLPLFIDYVSGANPVASFDNELALLWWPLYPRSSWQANPMHHQMTGIAAPRTLMTARLDAPQPGIVREMILASLKTERDGLKGRVVLDSRGIAPRGDDAKPGGYGWYDQSIRNLAHLLRSKTKLAVLHEDSPELLAENGADNIAVYCGWYRVRQYSRLGHLNPGAVAVHVASFELVSLKNEDETGWVRGLLNDGAAASMGAVAEPFLSSFPRADEFFPLLFTGRLTLAECYWKTNLYTSWMLSLVGDPLYTPYRKDPPLSPIDLPAALRNLAETPATRPADIAPAKSNPTPQ